ncbi:MAG: 3-dehydroquinate synthase [Deltaproteobacteria bacterium]|nr:3-dehydroquinate synthase [Deltaproteobacteria bacterium]
MAAGLFRPAGPSARGIPVVAVDDAEHRKNLEHEKKIFDKLIALKLDRQSVLVAVGGGVVTDMVGFAAAVFQRGIRWIAVPTTLTGQVDAALGGKTGVDHQGKNMLGAFWQPALVMLAPAFLTTLPLRERRAGFAEVVKTGVALRPSILADLEKDPDSILVGRSDTLLRVIKACAREKLAIVARDPGDRGVRAVLNLGHTVGHAIEAAGGYRRWNHGEAVAMGLLVECSQAADYGKMTVDEKDRVARLIWRLGLVPKERPEPERVRGFLRLDKKGKAIG